MHNFKANYEKILKVLKQISREKLLPYQRRKPVLADIEVIAINLRAEYLGIDSECDLFRKLTKDIRSGIERSVYNRRRRRLFPYLEKIRADLSASLNIDQDHFLVDSMPLEVCKLSRSSRSKVCRDSGYGAPDKGYCASQSSHYYGYKLHATCSVSGVFQSIDISPASVHEIHYLKDIKAQLKNCTLIGDRGYLSAQYQLNLFETRSIKLDTPMRRNQKNYREQPYIYRKSRKRIETLFSQLCDQFMIRRNYAKSFEGFKTRILSKISALTIVQFINKVVFNRNINNIKISII